MRCYQHLFTMWIKSAAEITKIYLPIHLFVHSSSCLQFLNIETKKLLSLLTASSVVRSIDAGRT